MAYKPMWDWMDKMEGKKEGSSHEALEKEKKRQGVSPETKEKKKKVAKKMNHMDKPVEESLLHHVKSKDKKKISDWEKRAGGGEVMRII